ncbi:MAG: hypothetical protein ACFE9I_04580 [Candidatus Hermodarchaeota archaeon]
MLKKRFIFILSIFLIVSISTASIGAKATSPMHLELSYDENTDILTVSFIHGVTDPDYHYVNSVTINVSDHILHNFTISNYYYTSQPTTNLFTYEYPGIIANEYDRIEVTANCNLQGSTLRVMEEVGHPHGKKKDSFASALIPSLISALFVFGIIMLPRLFQKRRINNYNF